MVVGEISSPLKTHNPNRGVAGGGVVIQRGSAFIWCLRIMIYGAFDLKFTSGNYDWDASNYEIGPFGRSLPLTTGNNNKFYMLVLS